MQNVTKEVIQQFISKNEITLDSTHQKLCIPIINRIYKKMSVGIKFAGIKVDGSLICDGHHRYIASLLANFSIEKIPATRTSATKEVPWETVIFENDDWDTPFQIEILNEQDARYNNLTMDEIIEILK